MIIDMPSYIKVIKIPSELLFDWVVTLCITVSVVAVLELLHHFISSFHSNYILYLFIKNKPLHYH